MKNLSPPASPSKVGRTKVNLDKTGVRIEEGISVLTVKNQQEGLRIAKGIIYKTVDGKTALFLSGGSTPKLLYQDLAKEEKLKVGAVAMVDERYFSSVNLKAKNEKPKFTNERMMEDYGLLGYLKSKGVPFRGILKNKPFKETVSDYNKVVRNLFRKFKKSVAVLGVGKDGHTAGLPAGRTQNSEFKIQDYVIGVDNFPGEFKERISLTFHALSKMDLLIVLVFGEEKIEALKLLFLKGPIPKVPARFLKTSQVSKKTLLITDLKI